MVIKEKFLRIVFYIYVSNFSNVSIIIPFFESKKKKNQKIVNSNGKDFFANAKILSFTKENLIHFLKWILIWLF